MLHNTLPIITKYGKRKWLKVESTDYLNMNRPSRRRMDTTTQTSFNTKWLEGRTSTGLSRKGDLHEYCVLCQCDVDSSQGKGALDRHASTNTHKSKRRAAGTSAPKMFFLRSYIAPRCHPLLSFVKSTSQSSIAWIRLNVDSVKAELQVCVNFTIPCTSMSQKFLGNNN